MQCVHVIDEAALSQRADAVDEIVRRVHAPVIALDLNAAEFLGSHLIEWIIRTRKATQRLKKQMLIVVAPGTNVRDVIEITRLNRCFDGIYDDIASALAHE